MITLRIPAVVDLRVLRSALEIVRKSNGELKLEPIWRVRDGLVDLDCDSVADVFALAEAGVATSNSLASDPPAVPKKIEPADQEP